MTALQICRKVRRWATKKAQNNVLSCWCGICSVKLWRELNKEGIYSEICHNEGHAFVKIGRFFADVTLTQFGGPSVYLKTTPYKEYHEILEIAQTDEEFMIQQEELGWPEYQIFWHRFEN